MSKGGDALKKIIRSNIYKNGRWAFFFSLVIGCIFAFLFYSCPNSLDKKSLLEFNASSRGMISIFTGMLGTMVSLIFSSNLDVLLGRVANRDGLKSLRSLIFNAFIAALFLLIYSIVLEVMFKIFGVNNYLFLSVGFVLFFVVLTYFVFILSRTVYKILNLALKGLNKKLTK